MTTTTYTFTLTAGLNGDLRPNDDQLHDLLVELIETLAAASTTEEDDSGKRTATAWPFDVRGEVAVPTITLPGHWISHDPSQTSPVPGEQWET